VNDITATLYVFVTLDFTVIKLKVTKKYRVITVIYKIYIEQ